MMLKKVLIVDDHKSIGLSIKNTLIDLNIKLDIRDHVTYCDAAYSRIQKALSDNEPYELLITDLSFDNKNIPQTLNDGIELIRAVRKIQKTLKVLIFSVENRSTVVNRLYHDLNLNGYVPKGHNDIEDLKAAIEKIATGGRYLSANLTRDFVNTSSFVFEEYDKTIISMLIKGKSQKETAIYLEKNNFKAPSLSTLEKRLKDIKSALHISSNVQLIAYCKDNNII